MFTKLLVAATLSLTGLVSLNAAEPYFSDHFLNVSPARWSVDATPPLSGFLIRPYQDGDQTRGELRMENRLTLLTKSKFPKGAHVSVRTTYEGNGNPLYANQCIIVMRTRGDVSSKRSWEITDGLRLRVEYSNGKATLEYVHPRTGNAEALATAFIRAKDPKEGLKIIEQTDEFTAPQIVPGNNGTNWYTVELVDNPKASTVEAFMTWHRKNGDASEENREKLFCVTYEQALAKRCVIPHLLGQQIAISSRGFKSGKLQVSFTREVKIESVK